MVVIPGQLLLMLLLLLVRRPLVAAVVMVVCLVSPRLLDRCALLDARVVALPIDLGVRRGGQNPSHGFTAGGLAEAKT